MGIENNAGNRAVEHRLIKLIHPIRRQFQYMSNHGGDSAARCEDRRICSRSCGRHSIFKGTNHTTAVICPTLDATDVALGAYPIIEDRLDNLMKRLRVRIHRSY